MWDSYCQRGLEDHWYSAFEPKSIEYFEIIEKERVQKIQIQNLIIFETLKCSEMLNQAKGVWNH